MLYECALAHFIGIVALQYPLLQLWYKIKSPANGYWKISRDLKVSCFVRLHSCCANLEVAPGVDWIFLPGTCTFQTKQDHSTICGLFWGFFCSFGIWRTGIGVHSLETMTTRTMKRVDTKR